MSGEPVGAGSSDEGGKSPASGESVGSRASVTDGASPVSGESVGLRVSVDEAASVGGEKPGVTRESPLSGESSGRAEGSPRGGGAAEVAAASPLSGDVSGVADVSSAGGENPGSTRVSPLNGETADVGAASPAGGSSAGLTSESPVSGDGSRALEDGGGARSAGRRFLARNRRALVTLAAVVVVVAALVVAVRVLPGGGSGEANSGNVAATATLTPSASGTVPSAAPTSVVPTQAGVPRAGEFGAWASRTSQWLDIPLRAMNGYAQATVTLSKEQPDCHLSWITLAAIGKIASDHGRAQGNRVGENGTLAKPLGTVEVFDFYHRPVSTPGAAGPLQLSPAVWGKFQRSASGGKPDIQNIDDSALTAGRALCANGRDLATDWWNGVATLEPAPVVLHRTLATTNVYGTVGQSDQPPNPAVLTAVDFAIDQIGLPYVWGGNGTRDADPGFDCSGLTTAAYASADVKLMRTADTQFRSVAHVSEPQLGDLIFYGEPASKIHHVGLYIGNQQMIDAPQTGQAVQVHPYRKPGDDYAGAGRPTA